MEDTKPTTRNLHQVRVIALAGLLHDIGKFRQRAIGTMKEKHQDISARVIQEFVRPQVHCTELEDADWNWVVDAAQYHHDPGAAPAETAGVARLIQLADGASASERHERAGEDLGKPLEEPLISCFSQLFAGESTPPQEWYQPVAPLTMDDKFLMPVPQKKDAFGRYAYNAVPNYDGMWKAFAAALPPILARATTLPAILESLSSLLEWACVNVPSATYKHDPDVSLFHHLKSTAALAACIAAQLQDNGLWDENHSLGDVSEASLKKAELILVGGDLSGIQTFLYNVPSKGALQTLRGRSFVLSAIVEAVSRAIVEQQGLPGACILYNSGGRFYVLAPAVMQPSLVKLNQTLEHLFFGAFRGQLYLAIATRPFTPKMLQEGGLNQTLQAVIQALNQRKNRRFQDVITTQGAEFFAPMDAGGTLNLCDTCGAELRSSKKITCDECDQYRDVGRVVAGADSLTWHVHDQPLPPPNAGKRTITWETILDDVGITLAIGANSWGAGTDVPVAWSKVCQLNDASPPAKFNPQFSYPAAQWH